jgi:hypothetical protein
VPLCTCDQLARASVLEDPGEGAGVPSRSPQRPSPRSGEPHRVDDRAWKQRKRERHRGGRLSVDLRKPPSVATWTVVEASGSTAMAVTLALGGSPAPMHQLRPVPMSGTRRAWSSRSTTRRQHCPRLSRHQRSRRRDDTRRAKRLTCRRSRSRMEGPPWGAAASRSASRHAMRAIRSSVASPLPMNDVASHLSTSCLASAVCAATGGPLCESDRDSPATIAAPTRLRCPRDMRRLWEQGPRQIGRLIGSGLPARGSEVTGTRYETAFTAVKATDPVGGALSVCTVGLDCA